MSLKPGLFSVSYAGLWGQERLGAAAFVERAASLGFRGVLLMAKRPHLSPLDADESALRAIDEALRRDKVELVGLAAYTDFLARGAAEIPRLEQQLAYVRDCCRITRRLGGSIVRIFTGYLDPSAPFQGQWEDVVAALRECGKYASDEGIVLAVQNHHDLAVDSASLARLLDEVGSPAVRAGFDAWSPALRGEELGEAARAIGGRVALTIAADYERVPRWRYRPELVNYEREEPDLVRAVAMGEGFIDYGSFFDGLEAGGYQGWAVYEMCSPVAGGGSGANLDAKARAFLAYMEKRERRGVAAAGGRLA